MAMRRLQGLLLAVALIALALLIAMCRGSDDSELKALRQRVERLEATTTLSPTTTTATATTTTTATATTTTTLPPTTTTTTTTTLPPTTTTTTTTTTAASVSIVDEEAVLTFAYVWGPSEEAVDLQTLLDIAADGWYGSDTQAAHIAELEARGLSTDNVPNPPPETTTDTEPPNPPSEIVSCGGAGGSGEVSLGLAEVSDSEVLVNVYMIADADLIEDYLSGVLNPWGEQVSPTMIFMPPRSSDLRIVDSVYVYPAIFSAEVSYQIGVSFVDAAGNESEMTTVDVLVHSGIYTGQSCMLD